jgi:threonine/homoserine/homoserine lactone efflux protein
VLETLIAFVAVSAIVICTPGQDTALTIRNTLAGGRRSGIATAGGVALGQAVWTVAASAGVVALLSASEPVFRALKLVGAAYLVYLGTESLWVAIRGRGMPRPYAMQAGLAPASSQRARPRPCAVGAGHARPSPHLALRQGVLSNLGNPKMAVFFASLLPQFVPEGNGSFAALLALGFLFCSLTFAWLTLYAAAVARLGRLLTGAVRRALDAVTGIVLVALGLRLAMEDR